MPARCLCFSPFLQQTLLIMASGALFPSLVSGSRGSSSKYLVEFRAGKMTMKGSTVTPDKRKGQVYIQQTDDSLIHFCWKDRTTGNVDDDLIIFPDDCEFKRVNQCTTGRVYVLKFKAGSKRLFFWMQVRSWEGGLQSLLGNMSHNQLMQLIGPTGLGGIDSCFSSPFQSVYGRHTNLHLCGQPARLLPVDLASVLTPEVMAPILANPEVQQRLMPYLPSGESLPQSSEELHNTLSSPQFQQQRSGVWPVGASDEPVWSPSRGC
ncbi:hypothetical protein GOODEAATRI_013656 [Goodea atripinnis]|uniref:Adhesion regulating molecule 1 n=1 Tax=Goodea atripinnis TaxID=208336 RepID=A0ABV0N177_9TELE